MTARDHEEYRALRATIRERGTARVCIFAGGVVAWAAAATATAALASTPLATLLPLLVLASVFETVFALHIGVERIGRYIQVFHETDAPAPSTFARESPERASMDKPASPAQPAPPASPAGSGWEHTAMAFGRPAGAVTSDALFVVLFLLAALCNIAPALIVDPARVELIFIGGAHALFVLRLLVARQAASRQRAIDLARFQQLKRDHG